MRDQINPCYQLDYSALSEEQQRCAKYRGKKTGNKKKDTGRSPHHSVALISPLSKQSVCLQHVPGTLERGSLPTTQKNIFKRRISITTTNYKCLGCRKMIPQSCVCLALAVVLRSPLSPPPKLLGKSNFAYSPQNSRRLISSSSLSHET